MWLLCIEPPQKMYIQTKYKHLGELENQLLKKEKLLVQCMRPNYVKTYIKLRKSRTIGIFVPFKSDTK